MIRVGDHSGDTHPTADSDLYLNSDQLRNNSLVINNLKLAIINCCSIVNKHAELLALIASEEADLILGTESHLDNSITNSEIFPTTFSVYRNDSNTHRGCVFVLVKNSTSSSLINTGTCIEIIWVKLHINNSKDIILGSFYCPPNSTTSTLDELHVSICEIKSKYPSAIIYLGGDFNCPGIDWTHGDIIDSYIPICFREKLITLSQDHLLTQVVTLPTRGPNILDLCFTTHSSTA